MRNAGTAYAERRYQLGAVLIVWNDANEKSRELLVKLPADLSPDHWDKLYPLIADRLLGIRKIAGWLR